MIDSGFEEGGPSEPEVAAIDPDGEALIMTALKQILSDRGREKRDVVHKTGHAVIQNGNGVSSTVTPRRQALGVRHEIDLGGAPISCRVWQVPGAETLASQERIDAAIAANFANLLGISTKVLANGSSSEPESEHSRGLIDRFAERIGARLRDNHP